MGYAPSVVRRARIDRYIVLFALVAAGCGAAPPTTTTIARAEPLPMTENQQGHRADAATETLGDGGPIPAAEPSIAGVYLWCRMPQGRACRLASAALGTSPKDLRGLPQSLMSVEDLSDDCTEPTIRTISARLSTAFGVQQSGWRDQGGAYLDPSTLGDMYTAAGCINDGEPALPIAKISAAASATPRVYLVRVWDTQLTP